MIKTEFYETRSDGIILERSYSDTGMMIERDGVKYSEAIDPRELRRVYTETDEPIEKKEPERTFDLMRRSYKRGVNES